MSLNIYTNDGSSNPLAKTPVARSCGFVISLFPNPTFTKQWPKINGGYIRSIEGIANESSSVSYATSWENAPGAIILDKIKEFTRAKAFKLFSGPRFDPNVATNSWTQQMPKDGANLSVTLNFRAYKQGKFMNTSSYLTIIQYLIFATSPLHDMDFMTEITNIGDAVSNAKKAGEKLGEELSGVTAEGNEIDETKLRSAEKVLESLEKTFKSLGTSSRGMVTFSLEVGDVIHASNTIDWIIKDWTMQPSPQFTEKGFPLWCDFTINLETNEKLSSTRLQSILFSAN